MQDSECTYVPTAHNEMSQNIIIFKDILLNYWKFNQAPSNTTYELLLDRTKLKHVIKCSHCTIDKNDYTSIIFLHFPSFHFYTSEILQLSEIYINLVLLKAAKDVLQVYAKLLATSHRKKFCISVTKNKTTKNQNSLSDFRFSWQYVLMLSVF